MVVPFVFLHGITVGTFVSIADIRVTTGLKVTLSISQALESVGTLFKTGPSLNYCCFKLGFSIFFILFFSLCRVYIYMFRFVLDH